MITFSTLLSRLRSGPGVCGGHESVIHVLLDCPELKALRRELRGKVGEAFNSMLTLLGEPGEDGRGKQNSASRAQTVKAVLDFAEASQLFQKSPQ